MKIDFKTLNNTQRLELTMKIIAWSQKFLKEDMVLIIKQKAKEFSQGVRATTLREVKFGALMVGAGVVSGLLVGSLGIPLYYFGFMGYETAKFTFIASNAGGFVLGVFKAVQSIKKDRAEIAQINLKSNKLRARYIETSELDQKRIQEEERIRETQEVMPASLQIRHEALKISLNWFLQHPRYKDFFCPITHEIMNEPVKAPDGKTYNRPALLKWYLDGNDICPCDPSKVLTNPVSLPYDEELAELMLELNNQFIENAQNRTREIAEFRRSPQFLKYQSDSEYTQRLEQSRNQTTGKSNNSTIQ